MHTSGRMPPPRKKGGHWVSGYITPPHAGTAPLGSTQTRPTILGSTHIPGSHLAAPLFLAVYPSHPTPTHQSCQGKVEQAHKPTHLGWILKTQVGALHPSSRASFSTDVFGLLSSPPADLIGEARPRAVPQGLPKSPLRPAPSRAAAPAFPVVVEVGQRLGWWPRTLLLGHRGRFCPSPWLLGSASDPPSRAHPPSESQPTELSRQSKRAAWPAACGGRFPSSRLWSRSLPYTGVAWRLWEAKVGTATGESLLAASKPLRFSKEK